MDASPVDPHPWRGPAALTLTLIAASYLASMVVMPWATSSPHLWRVSPDFWAMVPAAHFVANGAFPYLYGQNGYPYTPGLPLYLAPAVLVAQALHLTDSFPFPIPHPTSWLVLCPWGGLTAFGALAAARRLTAALGRADRAPAVTLAVAAVALPPIAVLYLHYEDVIVLALLLLAACLVLDARWRGAALAVGAAIAFKQTALFAAPLVLLLAPAPARRRIAAYLLAPAALLAGICLAFDWSHAAPALLGARATLHLGHHQLWVTDPHGLLVGAPLRAGALALAVLAAWRLRGSRDPLVIVAGFGVSMLVRIPFEPTLFSYYLAPAVAFAIVFQAGRGRDLLPTVGLCLGSLLWFALHPAPALWWLGLVALGAGAFGPMVLAVARRRVPGATEGSAAPVPVPAPVGSAAA